MSHLEEILSHKREEVRTRKELYPVKLLEKSIYFATPTVSLSKYLTRPDLLGIIAEIKRKSPSKGVINKYISVEELSVGYMQAGASALSVLTDEKFFGGTLADLTTARKFNFCPILRKDFTIDEYQILEAKSAGADVILLITEALETDTLGSLARFAKSLGLEVLLEVHSKDELQRALSAPNILDAIDVIGVNNRDLKTFSVDVNRSLELLPLIPPSCKKISESGIDSAEAIVKLRGAGFNGFLIGEAFMKTAKPELACARLIRSAHELSPSGIIPQGKSY